MGITTHCIITIYTQDKEEVHRYEISKRADGFLYSILNDGGADPDFERFNTFTAEEKEEVLIYFDAKSMSVYEELATPRPNLKDPKILKPIWLKIKDIMTKEFKGEIVKRHTSSEFEFEIIDQIIRFIDIAIETEHLIEITAADY